MILQHEIGVETAHRDWLLKLAAGAEPKTAEAFRREAADLTDTLQQAQDRAKRYEHADA